MPDRAVVVGGGLAGLTAALDLADAGVPVTLLERRRRLGGLTWSFEHQGRQVDNGQHVFLRCCEQYLGWLRRIGSDGDVEIQPRLEVTAVRPAPSKPAVGTLRRTAGPAPVHLAPSVLRYRHLRPVDRIRAVGAVTALRRLDPADPSLDGGTFGAWLARHGQGPPAVEALWDLITVATVNLPASDASLAMGAMVFRTGLLTDPAAADIGWARVPLGTLHGERAAAALAAAGVEVRLGARARSVVPGRRGTWRVEAVEDDAPSGAVEAEEADAVVVAVPHQVAGDLLPAGAVPHQRHLTELGTSAIVNIHVVFDRPVTDRRFFAAVGSPVHWVFDRTASSGHAGPGQYLAVTVSAADHLLGRRPDDLAAATVAELRRLLPGASRADVVDTLVTKERSATFRAVPGSGRLRPPAATRYPGLAVAGAWTDTGWPATMEGAVRSGHAAAHAVLLGAAPPLTPTRQREEVA